MKKINIIKGNNITIRHGYEMKEEIKVPKTSFRIDRTLNKDVAIYLDGSLKFARNMTDVTIQDGAGAAPVQLTSDNWDDLTEDINSITGGSGGSGSGDGYVRPSDRPAPPMFAPGEQAVYWLFGVQEHGLNDYAFRITESSGSYTVDWGDGTVQTVSSAVTAEHAFNFSTLNKPVGSEGYKWVWIKATPATGDITALNISQFRPSWRPAASSACLFVPQVFEIYLQAPEVTDIPFSSSYYTRNHLLEIFKYDGSNKITSFSYFLCLCCKLRRLFINTGNGTNFSYFLYSCYSFNQPLNIDTGNGTNFSYFLNLCTSFNQPLNIDTGNGTNFSNFLNLCYSFNQPLNIDTGNGTNFSNFLDACYSFNQPLNIDTGNGTNFDVFLNSCYSFNQPLNIDTGNGNGTAFYSFLNACYSFNQPLNIDTGKGTNFNNFLSNCQSFNQPLNIDTGKGTNFNNILQNCRSFNHNLNLDVQSLVALSSYFLPGGLNSLTGLRLSNLGLAQNNIKLTDTAIAIDALMELLNDLPDRTSTTAGVLTITRTPATMQITPGQIAQFTAKNWTLVL